MKRQYSFNEISRITMGAPENDPKPQSQPYYTSSKPRDCWTDMRVEQIKKKYDTPSHRKNYSHYGNNQRSKQAHPDLQSNNPYASYRNPLRDSLTSPNIIKKDKPIYANAHPKQDTQYRSGWEEAQHVPRFSYDSKENTNFMEKFSQIKNSMRVEQKPVPKTQTKVRDYPSNTLQSASSSKIDPRVQNIDKINMKIKKILDCLNQNQKVPRGQRLEQRADMKNSFMKGSIISKDNHSEQLEQTKILSRQKIGYEKQQIRSNLKRSNTSNQKYLVSPMTPTYQYKQEYKHDKDNQRLKLEEKYERYSQKYEEGKKDNYQQRYGYLKSTEEKGETKGGKVEDQSDSWFEPSKNTISKNRSRSCLGNFKQDEIKLNSGKKLDDEISKINVRIREFQEEKKKLNIEFKPYNCELKYNRSSSNLTDHKTQRSLKPPLPRPASKAEYNPSGSYIPLRSNYQEKMKTQSSQYMNRSTFESKKQSYELPQRYTIDNTKNSRPTLDHNKPVPEIKLFQDRQQEYKPAQEYRPSQQYKPMNRVNSAAQISIESIKIDQRRQQSSTPQFLQREYRPVKQESEQNEASNMNTNRNSCREECPQPNKFSEEFKLKTQEGIEERKRKLLQTATVSFSRETKRLITNLFEQVKLDEDLRNAKIWFRDLASLKKWDQLLEEAQRAGIQFNRAEFEVSEEEDNPFYSVRQSQESYECLVHRWIKAEKYWQDNIQGQFNLKQFQVQKFTEDKVDLERKGYFVVEDLVRFLNMETGTFYRNRDLILVFRRLGSSSEKLHWQQFLAKLDQQQ